jgi:uncharacterized protein YfaT (DUF1175 family)
MRRPTLITLCALLTIATLAAALLLLRASDNPFHSSRAATTHPDPPAHAKTWSDTDRDGLPDGLELTHFSDRENFRRWFTRIAEGQFYRTSGAWNTQQRDCAGLVRFSLREALRRHDRAWLKHFGAEYDAVAPDVRRYTLERAPMGERLFRTRAGEFTEANRDDATFSEFADARTLKEFNTEFVARDRRQAQPGDLLFFHQPWGQRYPFHVMIFTGTAHVADEEADAADWVVYHTGASPDGAGTIKKVRLSTLDRHPDARWRPVASNPRFLGFYRLKILT